MNCPICNKQMKIGRLNPDDSMATIWISIMPCDCICSHGAPRAVWEELIKTKQALNVAVDALKRIKNHATAVDTAISRAEIALDEIKQIIETKGGDNE